jgi:hypothetical protein
MPYPFHIRQARDRSTPLEHPSRQGSIGQSMLPIQPPTRRIALTLGLLASLALPAAADASQLIARVDYSGGWGTYRRALARGFANTRRRYSRSPLAWFVTGCTMPDCSHWGPAGVAARAAEPRARRVEADPGGGVGVAP